MRSVSLLVIAVWSLKAFGQPPGKYRIMGEINNGLKEGKVFVRYWGEKGPVLDSSVVKGGKFTVSGMVPVKPTIARLYVVEKNKSSPGAGDITEVWLEKANIYFKAEGDLIQSEFSGTKLQEQFNDLQSLLGPIRKENKKLDDAFAKADSTGDARLKDQLLNEGYPRLYEKRQLELGKFIRKYPASLISAVKFGEFAGDDRINLEIVVPVYELLDDKLKNHPLLMHIVKRIEINKKTKPGMEAPQFSQTDTSGNLVSLGSFRGKYLLIDFWAGWCMPCRAENPHLRSVYTRYKEKGLEILGVSLDGERKRWVNAIVDDSLSWTQVSDLLIFENAVAEQYGIISIPQNLLIDPAGKIVAWNLRGLALEKRLEQVFASP